MNVLYTGQRSALHSHRAKSQWAKVYKATPLATHRAILLPHASGSASFFKDWAMQFPAHIEVVCIQYPGREDRQSEDFEYNMDNLISALSYGIRSLINKPYLIFGHSMGGGIAYELYQAISKNGWKLPERLVISAFEAPSRKHTGSLYTQSDKVLIDELMRLGGTDVDLFQNPDLANLVLPRMRSDYRLIEEYTPASEREKIAKPITVMVGDRDDELLPGDAQAWQEETSGNFEIQTFEGGHFYLKAEKDKVISSLTQLLRTKKAVIWPVMP